MFPCWDSAKQVAALRTSLLSDWLVDDSEEPAQFDWSRQAERQTAPFSAVHVSALGLYVIDCLEADRGACRFC